MNQDQPIRPANIANIVAINQGRLPLTMDEPHAPSLSPADVSDLIGVGHIVVDTRSEAAFGSGHVPGSYSIQLASPEFEQRVGWVTPLNANIILVAESESDEQRALHALAFLGLDARVKGCLAGAIAAWVDRGHPLATLPQISVQELNARLRNGREMQVLDVRDTYEWDAGHIDGAHYVNYKYLHEQFGQLELGAEDPLAVVCAEGMRSSTACSILLQNGFDNVYNTIGGMNAWLAASLPTT
jgi:hydroxyacylglutathione hydrolase